MNTETELTGSYACMSTPEGPYSPWPYERPTRHWSNVAGPRRLDRKWRGRKVQPPNARSGWREQEARLHEIHPGGREQRGSGSGRGASSKGDSTGDYFLISGKTTEKKGMRVERDWLEEIVQQARNVGKRPALAFGFDRDDDGQQRNDWLALPVETAKDLIEIAVALHEGETAKAKALANLLLD